MDWRRQARRLGLVGAAIVVVAAVPWVVYLLATRPPATSAEDWRALAAVARAARAIPEKGDRRAPDAALAEPVDWQQAGKVRQSGGIATPETTIVAEHQAWAELGTQYMVWVPWIPTPTGTKPFFHGRTLDWDRFRLQLKEAIAAAIVQNGSGPTTYTAVTAAFHSELDFWEEQLLDPASGSIVSPEYEYRCQWAIVRAFHRGDTERARWMLFEYFRKMARLSVWRNGRAWDDGWRMRMRFVMLLDQQGLLDAATLAGLQQATEIAVLTDEEHMVWRKATNLLNADKSRLDDRRHWEGMSPLLDAGVARIRRAILQDASILRPERDVALAITLAGSNAYSGLRLWQETDPAVLALLPWSMNGRARILAELDTLRFVLAAMRFHREQGRWPAGDEDLVGSYLPADFCETTYSRWTVEEFPEVDSDVLAARASASDPFGGGMAGLGNPFAGAPPSGTPGVPIWGGTLCFESQPVFVRFLDDTTPTLPRGGSVDMTRPPSGQALEAVKATAKIGPSRGKATATMLAIPWRWEEMIRALEGIPALPGVRTPTARSGS